MFRSVDDFVKNLVATFATDLGATVARAVEAAARQSGGLAAAITYLRQEPGIGVEQLRAALGLSQPATVRLVNQLVDAGLAARTPHGHDGRRVSLTLTGTGRSRADDILAARSAAVEGFLDGLSGAQQRQLVELIAAGYRSRQADPAEAEHICRLCDVGACPAERCPVTPRG
jgi:MarR family transcriptional regulator, negative regulator of the multidrug operon emrRAB